MNAKDFTPEQRVEILIAKGFSPKWIYDESTSELYKQLKKAKKRQDQNFIDVLRRICLYVLPKVEHA